MRPVGLALAAAATGAVADTEHGVESEFSGLLLGCAGETSVGLATTTSHGYVIDFRELAYRQNHNEIRNVDIWRSNRRQVAVRNRKTGVLSNTSIAR